MTGLDAACVQPGRFLCLLYNNAKYLSENYSCSMWQLRHILQEKISFSDRR